jgi:hypothetical protein
VSNFGFNQYRMFCIQELDSCTPGKRAEAPVAIIRAGRLLRVFLKKNSELTHCAHHPRLAGVLALNIEHKYERPKRLPTFYARERRMVGVASPYTRRITPFASSDATD